MAGMTIADPTGLRTDIATFIRGIQSPDVVYAMRQARQQFNEVLHDREARGISPAEAVQRGEHMRRVINSMGLTAIQVAAIGRCMPPSSGAHEEFAQSSNNEQIFAHILRAFDHVIEGTAKQVLARLPINTEKGGKARSADSSYLEAAKQNPPAAIAAAVELTQAALNPDCTNAQRDEASANFKDLMSQIGLNATLVLPDAEPRPGASDSPCGEVEVTDKDFTNIAYKLLVTDPAVVPVFQAIVAKLDIEVAPLRVHWPGPPTKAAKDALATVVDSLSAIGLKVPYLADLGRQLPYAEGEDAYVTDPDEENDPKDMQLTWMRRAIYHALVGARKNAKPTLTPEATDAVERRRAFEEMGAMLAAKDAEAAEPVQRDEDGNVSLRSKMRRQAYEWMNANPGKGRPDLHVNGRHVLDQEADPTNTSEQPYSRTTNFQSDLEEAKVFVESMKHLTNDALSKNPEVRHGVDNPESYSMYLSIGGARPGVEGARECYWRVFTETTFLPEADDATGRIATVVFPPGLYPLYLPPGYPEETSAIVARMRDCGDEEQVKPVLVTRFNVDPHENGSAVPVHAHKNHGSGKAQAFWSSSELRDCVFAHFKKAQPELMAYCHRGDDPEAKRLLQVMREKVDELATEKMRQGDLDTQDKVVAIVDDLHAYFLTPAGAQAIQNTTANWGPPIRTKETANAVTDELDANDRHVMRNADNACSQMDFQEARSIDTDCEEMWNAAKDYQNLCDRLRHKYKNQCSRDVWERLLYARERAKALVLRCSEHHLTNRRAMRRDQAASAQREAAFDAYSALAKEAGHKVAVATGLRDEGKLDDAARVFKTALGMLKEPKFDPNDLSPEHRATLADQVRTCEGVVDTLQAQRAQAKEEERKARKAANRAARDAEAPSPSASSPDPAEQEESPPRNRRDNTAHKRRQRARKREQRFIGDLLSDAPQGSDDNAGEDDGPKDWAAMAANVEDSMRAAAECVAARESADLAEAMARSLLLDDESNPSENKLCVICFEEPKSHACVPCGHQCLCAGCAANPRVNKICPLCRTPVQMVMKVLS